MAGGSPRTTVRWREADLLERLREAARERGWTVSDEVRFAVAERISVAEPQAPSPAGDGPEAATR